MTEETKLKSQMGSDEPVKFTDEELSSLQELQNTYASISTQFGQVKVSRINLERQIENLDDAENQLEQSWEENRQTESDLVKSLNEKYGAGSLNPTTGEFIPQPTQEVENN
jgi:septal ring factor EnvC (AmiA/AmiB activator)